MSQPHYIDRLLTAAKKYPNVKRLWISEFEVKTDPLDARDSGNDKGGWPAAWAIAEDAGVSGGCGNHGQHQLSLSMQDKILSYPDDYRRALGEHDIASAAERLAAERLEQRIAAVVTEWRATDEAQALQKAHDIAARTTSETYQAVVETRPTWLRGGGWIEVPA